MTAEDPSLLSEVGSNQAAAGKGWARLGDRVGVPALSCVCQTMDLTSLQVSLSSAVKGDMFYRFFLCNTGYMCLALLRGLELPQRIRQTPT